MTEAGEILSKQRREGRLVGPKSTLVRRLKSLNDLLSIHFKEGMTFKHGGSTALGSHIWSRSESSSQSPFHACPDQKSH